MQPHRTPLKNKHTPALRATPLKRGRAGAVVYGRLATLTSIFTPHYYLLSKINFQQTAWNEGDGIKRLYHADNIDVLNALINDNDVCGKVTLIYIDPPYNTGGAFETRDFKHAYDDCFSTESYLEFPIRNWHYLIFVGF